MDAAKVFELFAANGNLPSDGAGVKADVMFGLYTDDAYGHMNSDGELETDYNSRPAWVVRISGVTGVVLGPTPPAGVTIPKGQDDFVVVYDASTGAELLSFFTPTVGER